MFPAVTDFSDADANPQFAQWFNHHQGAKTCKNGGIGAGFGDGLQNFLLEPEGSGEGWPHETECSVNEGDNRRRPAFHHGVGDARHPTG